MENDFTSFDALVKNMKTGSKKTLTAKDVDGILADMSGKTIEEVEEKNIVEVVRMTLDMDTKKEEEALPVEEVKIEEIETPIEEIKVEEEQIVTPVDEVKFEEEKIEEPTIELAEEVAVVDEPDTTEFPLSDEDIEHLREPFAEIDAEFDQVPEVEPVNEITEEIPEEVIAEAIPEVEELPDLVDENIVVDLEENEDK